LYGVHEQWVGAPVWSCAIAEVVAILAGIAALAQSLPTRSDRGLRQEYEAG
jgi:hypothetical protein